jgi:20S proteasome alpha/beta subunit
VNRLLSADAALSGDFALTVCVAAIFGSSGILGASDRMLTAGDVQFEPQQPKIRPITSSIVVMIAGHSPMQEEILQTVARDVATKIDSEPTKWLDVADVAEFYRVRCNDARNKRSENSLLAPLGLNLSTFITQQAFMNTELISKLATELINFRPPDVEAIIAGVDGTGPHIYVARNSDITCQDGVGFAAIGAGYWHANSQLMFAGHTRNRPLPESLLLVYKAKRRAEVAPGVGRDGTDMFFIPSVGKYDTIGDHVLKELDNIYRDVQREENTVTKQSIERVNEYVEALPATTTTVEEQQTAVPKDGGGDAPSDEEVIRDGTTETAEHGTRPQDGTTNPDATTE